MNNILIAEQIFMQIHYSGFKKLSIYQVFREKNYSKNYSNDLEKA